MGWVIFIELAVPLLLLAAIALVRNPDLPSYILHVLALGLALFFCWLVFPWDVVSIHWRRAVAAFALVAVFVGARRIGTSAKPRSETARRIGIWVNAGVAISMAGLCWRVLAGYPAPPDRILLEAPLRDAQYVVGHGGGSPFINRHFRVTPQNYALDLLGVNRWGRRVNPQTDPGDLESYAIFGAWVYAPCPGRVTAMREDLPDLAPGQRDRKNLAGNHVLLDCGSAEVVLAHLRQDSVTVEVGEAVRAGQRMGQVGNSGNTSEPHLHMHAERGGAPAELLNGEPVAMIIDGRFLVRGDILGPAADR